LENTTNPKQDKYESIHTQVQQGIEEIMAPGNSRWTRVANFLVGELFTLCGYHQAGGRNQRLQTNLALSTLVPAAKTSSARRNLMTLLEN
jgi:hypothetical protein